MSILSSLLPASPLRRRRMRSVQAADVQSLEDRVMLAGDVSAILRNGDLIIRGDAEDNAVEVRTNEDGYATVYGLSGTTVNGSADPWVFAEGNEIADDVRVALGRGSDSVFIEGIDVSGDVWIRGHRGNDAVGMYNSSVGGNLWALGGAGSDYVSVDNVDVSGNMVVATFLGNDTIGVDAAFVDGFTRVYAGSGADRIGVTDSVHNGYVAIAAGFGNDYIGVSGTEFGSYVRATGGFGSDDVAVSDSDFSSYVLATGGYGSDAIDVEGNEFGRDPWVFSFESDSVEDVEGRQTDITLDLVSSGARLGTIAEIAILNPDTFSTLVDAVVAADLVGALDGTDLLTVFAPTNDAFAALPDGTLDGLLEDPSGDLTDILLYHVSLGVTNAATLVGQTSFDTLNGAAVGVEVVEGGVVLNQSVNVIATDIRAKNGLIHVIDGVLLPPAELA